MLPLPDRAPAPGKAHAYRNTENDLEDGPVLGGPMWLSDPEGSMATDGKRCAAPFAALTPKERGRVLTIRYSRQRSCRCIPTMCWCIASSRCAVDRTRVVCDWYFHPDAMAAPAFDAAPAIAFWDLTNRQDWALCEGAFRGISSSAWEPGPYSELESQLAAFDRHYLATLGDDAA